MEGAHKVTLAIFSGVPDPTWEVHPKHGSSKKMKDHLSDARKAGNIYRHEHMPAILGYKGFLVEPPQAEEAELVVGHETKELQKLLLDTMPEGLISKAFREKIRKEIVSAGLGESQKASPQKVLPASREASAAEKKQHYAPALNLDRWNIEYLVRNFNNCYNYANDKITNSFAQPGKASGHSLGKLTPHNVVRAAESDGLVKMDVAPGAPCPKAPKQPNCLVALFVYEDPDPKHSDYHWYRLDDNKRWSHKPGITVATNLDGDGKEIDDPRKAAMSGIEYKFVTFMKIYTNIIDGWRGPHPSTS